MNLTEGDKKTWRSVLRRMSREELTTDVRNRASEEICRRLIDNPKLSEAQCIGFYMALPDEPEISAVIRHFLDAGKTVAVPRVEDAETMRFLQLRNDTDFSTDNAFGIPEPSPEDAPEISSRDFDLIVVPALAFDAAGFRLGRGKGYYDRYLALAPQAYTIGVTIGLMKPEQLPHDEWDLPMNEVYFGL